MANANVVQVLDRVLQGVALMVLLMPVAIMIFFVLTGKHRPRETRGFEAQHAGDAARREQRRRST